MKIFLAGTTEHSLDNKIAFVKVESKQVEFNAGKERGVQE